MKAFMALPQEVQNRLMSEDLPQDEISALIVNCLMKAELSSFFDT